VTGRPHRGQPGGRRPTLCVYALASPADRHIRATGIAGERLRTVQVGRLTAIVGEPPRPPTATAASMRKYDGVLHALAARLPAVLPARFGTCFDDPEELTMILRARQRTFISSLRLVRGRVQMTARLVEASALPGPPGERDTVSARSEPISGAQYLHARAAEAARAREVAGFAPLRSAVRRWVRDERVEKRGRLATVYHLVPRASAPAYRRALERAADAAGVRVIVSGPWPPYAFTTAI
jgi:hypothetical protein